MIAIRHRICRSAQIPIVDGISRSTDQSEQGHTGCHAARLALSTGKYAKDGDHDPWSTRSVGLTLLTTSTDMVRSGPQQGGKSTYHIIHSHV